MNEAVLAVVDLQAGSSVFQGGNQLPVEYWPMGVKPSRPFINRRTHCYIYTVKSMASVNSSPPSSGPGRNPIMRFQVCDSAVQRRPGHTHIAGDSDG